jgi:hypothetical protein
VQLALADDAKHRMLAVHREVRQVDVAFRRATDHRLAGLDPAGADDLTSAGLAGDQTERDRLGHVTSRRRR